MAPTIQVACKAFIAPDSAARFPNERYMHVRSCLWQVRHTGRFLVDRPKVGRQTVLALADEVIEQPERIFTGP
jgi:hypothetical protein